MENSYGGGLTPERQRVHLEIDAAMNDIHKLMPTISKALFESSHLDIHGQSMAIAAALLDAGLASP